MTRLPEQDDPRRWKAEGAVTRLDAFEARLAVDVLCEAFAAYPVFPHVIGDVPDYERRLQRLIGFFVMARVVRDEPILAVRRGAEAAAAAIVTLPGRESPSELGEARERTWAELGPEARARYEAFGAACGSFEIDAPSYHLNMIGVRAAGRGQGLGRLLLDYVHEMSRLDPGSNGVTLTTETEVNVRLYEHLGYELVGHVRVADDLESWGFFRPDAG